MKLESVVDALVASGELKMENNRLRCDGLVTVFDEGFSVEDAIALQAYVKRIFPESSNHRIITDDWYGNWMIWDMPKEANA